MSIVSISSVSGFLSLLNDQNHEIRNYALKRLLELVEIFWIEICDSVETVEVIFENEKSKLAALLASKIYYYLDEIQQSVDYGLHAEELFDLSSSNEFVDCIVAKCIDRYIDVQVSIDKGNSLETEKDIQLFSRLECVVERLIKNSFQCNDYRNLLGIAIEARRIDLIEKIISKNSQPEINTLLRMTFKIALTTIFDTDYQKRLLNILVELHLRSNRKDIDYLDLFNCLICLMDASKCARIFCQMIQSNDVYIEIAYQVAFDMLELGNQGFLSEIILHIFATNSVKKLFSDQKHLDQFVLENTYPMCFDNENVIEVDIESSSSCICKYGCNDIRGREKNQGITVSEEVQKENLFNLVSILNGDKKIELITRFILNKSKVDLRTLDKLKSEVRHSVTHNATIIANGIMNYGTNSVYFLSENVEWLARATNWSKFSACASLGLIHRGQEKDCFSLMETYLPKDLSSSPFTEGGSLFALGLIHAGHGRSIRSFFLKKLSEKSSVLVRHGGILGLGVSCICTFDQEVNSILQDLLIHDNEIIGEAAGFAIGLVNMGSLQTKKGLELFEMLIQYAHDTKHDKIIRACAIGCALLCFNCQSSCEEQIKILCTDTNVFVRAAGAYAIGMAYCGTAYPEAVQRLLNMSVNDGGDDAKRAAVSSLGFVLCNQPKKLPSLVRLLSESFNPHLRYGSAIAVGMACAGTGLKEALNIIEPLMQDRISFVRQGAYIAMSLICMQLSPVICPQVIKLRDDLLRIISDKYESTISKFGAIIGIGLLNAGGQNVSVALRSRTGGVNWTSAAGLLLFQSYWNWFPLVHMISLAFTTTTLTVLTKDLRVPKVKFLCNSKNSVFDYLPPLPVELAKRRSEKSEYSVMLSVTAKEMKRANSKRSQSKLSLENENPSLTQPTSQVPKPQEPTFTILQNPARVLPMQAKLISFYDSPDEPVISTRYLPMRPITTSGIILLHDLRPNDDQEFLELTSSNSGFGTDSSESESFFIIKIPECFIWTELDEDKSMDIFNLQD